MIRSPCEMIEALVGFPTVSRDSNLELIHFVRDYLAGFGVESHLVPNEDATKANLLATVGPEAEGGVVLSGHTDVVPDETTIEPVLELRQTALRILGSNRVAGAAQGVLDVAENRVHPSKLGTLDRGFPAADHHRLMHAACRGHGIEAGQPIGEHLRARAEVLQRDRPGNPTPDT